MDLAVDLVEARVCVVALPFAEERDAPGAVKAVKEQIAPMEGRRDQ